jgi:DNA processing protein
MDRTSTTTHNLEELLGPFNDVERRHAPQGIFAAGRLELVRQGVRVAVVGSRRPSDAGLRRAARLAHILAAHQVIVVSGLAAGVDACAHRSAMEMGGTTVAVLGTPLDTAYPPAHRGLQKRIAREHLALSQFPVGSPVQRKNFTIRNRTMALVCDASVIVEAGEGSGTLSHGWEALRLGRPLFLMRSLLSQAELSWPAKMLDYGALVLSEPEELLDSLPSPRAWHPEDAPF